MAFAWKNKKDMFKGEGIYFLTFGIKNRLPLLGELKRFRNSSDENDGHFATVDGTDLGKLVYQEFNSLQFRHKGLQVVAKQIMPTHFHAVVWCKEEFGSTSIKMVARGFAQACSKAARRMHQQRLDRFHTNGIRERILTPTTSPLSPLTPHPSPLLSHLSPTMPSIPSQSHCEESLDCGNGANTLFEKPFIRTLSHPGQLRKMIDYTHSNPDNSMLMKENPGLYVIRRCKEYAGLKFDTMGKSRLLDYPDRNVIALSRSLTDEQIDEQIREALRLAESGTVTYTAAINKGEKSVAKAVREAGWPLVVMMLDGFPPEGSEAERYYHPNGVYHTACGKGHLLLMSPSAENYNDPRLIDLTEQELARKSLQKGYTYTGIPHDSKRWRMIAGNIMLHMISEL